MAGVQVFRCPRASKICCVCKKGRQSQELGKHLSMEGIISTGDGSMAFK